MGVEQSTANYSYNRRIALNLAAQLPDSRQDALEVVEFLRQLIGFIAPDQPVFPGNAERISDSFDNSLPDNPDSLPK